VSLWLAVLVVRLSADAAPAPMLPVSLRILVAECPGADGVRAAPVQPPEWVEAHVQAVQSLLAPHGIAVTATRASFVPPTCEALTREDRDRFVAAVAPGPGVTVLVVPRVRDLDVPSYDLRGVHWRAGGRRWIFLTARARPPVLAHELCHYFGLPHDPAGGNLMTPGPSSPAWQSARKPRGFAPVLTAAQVRTLRAGIARSARQVADVREQVVR
jgi:hypothetical protein